MLHGLTIDEVIGGSVVLKTVYLMIGCIGLGAYAYDELAMRRRAPTSDLVVSGTRRLSADILELVLEPRANTLAISPGQFVFLLSEFRLPREGEQLPPSPDRQDAT